MESKLLTVLVRYAGRVGTQGHVLQEVWGPHQPSTTHYVRVYIGQLRHTLEANLARPRYLVTEPGVGISSHDRRRKGAGVTLHVIWRSFLHFIWRGGFL